MEGFFMFLLSNLAAAFTDTRTNTEQASFGKFGWNWEVESRSERKMLQLKRFASCAWHV